MLVDRTAAFFILFALAFSCGFGCDPQPCTESGAGTLLVPDARAAAISNIRTAGAAQCTVSEPRDCGHVECVHVPDAGLARLFEVKAAARGDCQVTLEFSDGCEAETVSLAFRGPKDNCCEDICETGAGATLKPTCSE